MGCTTIFLLLFYGNKINDLRVGIVLVSRGISRAWTCPPPHYLNVMGGGRWEWGVGGGKLVVLRARSLGNVGEICLC